MIRWSEMNCTHSSVLSKNGRSFVLVRFERGEHSAEGSVPECMVLRSNGFTQEEIEELEDYMYQNRQEIIDAAKSISNIKHLFS
ncbi:MAG: hypothetical protein NC092_14310 [Butyrivibrio sp.]|nr:hypothetical protein [Muribaculum sp.]MCM1553843.1 hypothetical protein [Butyrivibrio sp.]